jgi:hypothetical protein
MLELDVDNHAQTPGDSTKSLSKGIGATTHRIATSKMPHHISLYQHGGHGILGLGHALGHKIHRCHEPLPHEALEVVLCDHGKGSFMFCHGSRGKEKQWSLSPKISLFNLSLSLSLLGERKKKRR